MSSSEDKKKFAQDTKLPESWSPTSCDKISKRIYAQKMMGKAK